MEVGARAGRRGALDTLLPYSTMGRHHRLQTRTLGGRRSEVKEEAAADRPTPGDMSAVGHPTSLSAATLAKECPLRAASRPRRSTWFHASRRRAKRDGAIDMSE